jgi:hypothetical protein
VTAPHAIAPARALPLAPAPPADPYAGIVTLTRTAHLRAALLGIAVALVLIAASVVAGVLLASALFHTSLGSIA